MIYDDDVYVMMDEKWTAKDWLVLVKFIFWRIPAALVGSMALYGLHKIDGAG